MCSIHSFIHSYRRYANTMEFYIGLQSNTISSSFDAMDNQLKRERERESSTRSNRFFFLLISPSSIIKRSIIIMMIMMKMNLIHHWTILLFFFLQKDSIQFVSFHQQLSSTDERRSYFLDFFPYVFWNFVWWNKNPMTLSCFL